MIYKTYISGRLYKKVVADTKQAAINFAYQLYKMPPSRGKKKKSDFTAKLVETNDVRIIKRPSSYKTGKYND